jgi:hypothetical protein
MKLAKVRSLALRAQQIMEAQIVSDLCQFNRDPVIHTWTYKLDKAA